VQEPAQWATAWSSGQVRAALGKRAVRERSPRIVDELACRNICRPLRGLAIGPHADPGLRGLALGYMLPPATRVFVN